MQMIARLENEMEERLATIDGSSVSPRTPGRDLTTPEMNQILELRGRVDAVSSSSSPRCARRPSWRSSHATVPARSTPSCRAPATAAPSATSSTARPAQYVADRYLAMMGDEGAIARTEISNRVAAHQTTADNPGLLPESIVGPIVNFVDTSRPIVSTVGPQDLGTGAWAYAKITQHTQVGLQAGEKTELASRAR
jgi:hypothetical protein